MITFVPGQGWVHSGDGGTPYVLGGELDQHRTEMYREELGSFLNAHSWDSDKDYSETWRNYFGTVSPGGSYTPSFGQGPNDRWGAALSDRLMERRRGNLSGVGNYERHLYTADRDYTGDLFDRNNAIEDMYRRGYDRSQIQSFLEGDASVLERGPSWRDYYRETTGQGDSSWADDYFIDAPEATYGQHASNVLGARFDAAGQRLAELFNRLNTSGLFDSTLGSSDVNNQRNRRENVTDGMMSKFLVNKGLQR